MKEAAVPNQDSLFQYIRGYVGLMPSNPANEQIKRYCDKIVRCGGFRHAFLLEENRNGFFSLEVVLLPKNNIGFSTAVINGIKALANPLRSVVTIETTGTMVSVEEARSTLIAYSSPFTRERKHLFDTEL